MTSIPPEAEQPYEDRVQLAVSAWKNANGTLSMREAARQHGISKSTLDYRIRGHMTATARNQKQQRLTPEEESALVNWILSLQALGWPPRVEQIRQMATELLVKKEDMKPLGVNWAQKFVARHPEVKTSIASSKGAGNKGAGSKGAGSQGAGSEGTSSEEAGNNMGGGTANETY